MKRKKLMDNHPYAPITRNCEYITLSKDTLLITDEAILGHR
ncbi:hypothetical protein [Jilunia laotingensis]|nr:hypothetical protein [Jilunia laotingensis]